jgi:uncharacterized protein YdcH (DUF465 family)
MLGELHDILHEFPEFKAKIEELKKADHDFALIMIQHDELDAEIRSLEEHEQPVSDTYMEDLKKRRAKLKDRIYEQLKA